LEGKHYVPVISFALLKFPSNTGTPNSFTGVDIQSLTGGVFNGVTLLEGNNLACFAYQLAAQAEPDVALGALDALTGAVGKAITSLGCPQLQAIDEAQLEAYPGYTKKPVYSK
jgi:hypothetical protein